MNPNKNAKRRPNPRQNANFLSIATFAYTLPTFCEGYRNEFSENDLYETIEEYRSEMLGNKVERLWNDELKKACRGSRSPSIRTVLIRGFGFEYFILGLRLVLMECVLKPAQALTLGRLVLLYTRSNDDMPRSSKSELYLYAGAVALLGFLNILLFHLFLLSVQSVALKVKIACCSLIYRKALKLNNAAFNKTNVGQMVNLLSNDVAIFMRCSVMLHYIWIGPIQCLIVTYLMYKEVGLSSIFGVLTLILCTPLYFYLGKIGSKYRLKTALRTDERVRFFTEIISGIQLIKMFAWEKPIESLLMSLRKLEMKYLRLSSYVKAAYLTIDILTMQIVLFITIVIYVINNDIKADKVYSLTIFYNSLRIGMAKFFPQGLGLAAETRISMARIEKFLLNSEIELGKVKSNYASLPIRIVNGTAKWKSVVTLSNINLELKRNCLVAVVGPVGCGKSSLLNVILRELPLEMGEIQISGKVSYASQDPWLFGGTVRDNILFGKEMDTERYNEVVRRCGLECDFDLLPYGDSTIVGGRGSSLSGGQKARINLARSVYTDSDIYLLDDPLSAVDSSVGKQIFQDCIKEFLKGKTVVLVTHQLNYLNDVDEVVVLENGTIQFHGKWKESHLKPPSLDEENFEEMVTNQKTVLKVPNEKIKTIQEVVKEQTSSGTVSRDVYKTYVSLGGNRVYITSIVVLVLLTQALISGSSYFLAQWVNIADSQITIPKNVEETPSNLTNYSTIWNFQDNYSKELYIYIYSTITVSSIIVACLRSYMCYSFFLRSSKQLFINMFKSLIRATMYFFNTNSQGRIINRFSKDMGITENILPLDFTTAMQLLLLAFASLILVIIVNYWLLIPTLLFGIFLYYLKRFCLTTTLSIKRLEGVCHSYVFEHLSSSLQGLSTIRAFESEQILKKEFDSHQDLNSCCYHLFLSTTEAFGFFFDSISSIYVAIVTFTFVLFDCKILGGDVGLAITQCINVSSFLQFAVRQTADVENNMTSVERILEYNSIEHEDDSDKKSQKGWPENGDIVFQDIFLKYSPQASPVLKNLNFKIASKEKIGIAGRTGAGKSSIVNALFRLNYLSGNILIDGVNITNLNLQELRSKMSIIPQDPVLFSGTLRENLDPFLELTDGDLWTVLDEVKLKNEIAALPAGLDVTVNDGGKNLSVGQRQLICLARAILRNNKILILDEATANVDTETDALIQRTIREKFKDCTVLTIAHRLNTIIDSDKILVMSAGEVVEFDKPSILLKNVNGHFYHMVQQMNQKS